MGKRHYPIYKIVAADSRFPRDGRFIEAVGTYNPNLDPMEVTLKEERVTYWLNVGAQPTDTVKNLLQSEGLILRRNLEKKGLTAEVVETEFQKFLANKDSKIKIAKEKKARRKLSKKAKKDTKDSGETKPAEGSAEIKAEEKKTVETPVVAAPVAETPVVEAPVTETPVAEVPVVEAPVAETPTAEAPVAEAKDEATPGAEKKSE